MSHGFPSMLHGPHKVGPGGLRVKGGLGSRAPCHRGRRPGTIRPCRLDEDASGSRPRSLSCSPRPVSTAGCRARTSRPRRPPRRTAGRRCRSGHFPPVPVSSTRARAEPTWWSPRGRRARARRSGCSSSAATWSTPQRRPPSRSRWSGRNRPASPAAGSCWSASPQRRDLSPSTFARSRRKGPAATCTSTPKGNVVPNRSTDGILASGVPGMVAGVLVGAETVWEAQARRRAAARHRARRKRLRGLSAPGAAIRRRMRC